MFDRVHAKIISYFRKEEDKTNTEKPSEIREKACLTCLNCKAVEGIFDRSKLRTFCMSARGSNNITGEYELSALGSPKKFDTVKGDKCIGEYQKK